MVNRKLGFLVLALMAAFLMTAGDALADRIRCGATASCDGTEAADVMSGTAKGDKIFGYGGNDEISGKGGDDTIVGGAGKDLIFGEAGNDTISGLDGNDQLFGNDGRDTFLGGKGDDTIDATFGEFRVEQDTVDCGEGNDKVIANRTDIVSSNCESVTRR